MKLCILLSIAVALLTAAATLAAWLGGEPAAAQGTADPVVFAAGDIACGADTGAAACKQMETSDLFARASPDAVLALGDLQYESGQYWNFVRFYRPSWGRQKGVTRPVIGNHELDDPAGRGTGYWDYFNGIGVASGPAGRRGRGYYSFDLGTWHLIALNSNCSQAGCNVGGTQEKWLRADLAAHPNRCTLAYMHHARWSSIAGDFDQPKVQPFIQALYDYGVDLLLVGHAHSYERFAPLDPQQNLDIARGTRHFIVGTGGRNVYGSGAIERGSEVRNGNTFGVLRLELHPQSYDWKFLPIAGQTFTDSGSASCHDGPRDTTPPVAPSGQSPATLAPDADEDGVPMAADHCPTVFAATSHGCPPDATLALAASLRKLTRALRRASISGLLRQKGATIGFTAPAAGVFRGTAAVKLRRSRASGAARVTVLTGAHTFREAGTGKVELKLRRKGRRVLRRARRATLELNLAFVDLAGRRFSASKAVRLRR